MLQPFDIRNRPRKITALLVTITSAQADSILIKPALEISTPSRCPCACPNERFSPKSEERTYIVSGKPYISENRAIMNASYIPRVRQFCFFNGVRKLSTKTEKIPTLKSVAAQLP